MCPTNSRPLPASSERPNPTNALPIKFTAPWTQKRLAELPRCCHSASLAWQKNCRITAPAAPSVRDPAREERESRTVSEEDPSWRPRRTRPPIARTHLRLIRPTSRRWREYGKLVEESSRLQAAYLKPLETGKVPTTGADEMQEVVRTLGRVAERWWSDPEKLMEAQRRFTTALRTCGRSRCSA